MLHDLGFTPLQYGLGFGVSCLGGILGARASQPLVRRYGQRKILLGFGVARVLWLLGLSFLGTGLAGLLLVMAVEIGMITCMGVFNPVFATHRLEHTEDGKMARVLTAWTISTRTAIAAATALWGVLAGLTSSQTAIATAGVLLLATSVLPWRQRDGDSSGTPRPGSTGLEEGSVQGCDGGVSAASSVRASPRDGGSQVSSRPPIHPRTYIRAMVRAPTGSRTIRRLVSRNASGVCPPAVTAVE
jgi:MFS family permease